MGRWRRTLPPAPCAPLTCIDRRWHDGTRTRVRHRVARPPQGSSLRPVRLSSRELVRQARYTALGVRSDLEGAICDFTEAVAQTPPGEPRLAGRLSNLGLALGQRYARSGDLDDLEQSVDAFERAVRSTPALCGFLNNLGMSLGQLHEHTRDPADLDRAVETLTAGLRSTPPETPEAARCAVNLGGAPTLRPPISTSG
ncbi:MAG: hypothetical protein GY842_29015 [bacterium]|nr:hypothetical protein [bacterium]